MRAGPAATAKDRAALLTALIRAITGLIDRIEGQTGLARTVASLKQVRQQAQALLDIKAAGGGENHAQEKGG